MSDSPLDTADVGQQPDTDPSPVDSASPAESAAVESVQPVELSEAEEQAEFLKVALKAADEASPKKADPATDETDAQKTDGADPAKPAAKVEPQAEPEPEDEGEDRGEGFGKHPRWKAMVAARNEYRNQAQGATRELDTLRTPAQQYGLIEQYMSENQLSPAEVTTGFKIMALMKADPAAAREALLDQLQMLNQFLGHALPADLQQQVDEGYVTEDVARELAYRRNNDVRVQQQQHQQTVQQQEQQAQQQFQAVRGQMAQAVASWETQIRQGDPDYAAKEPFVVRELQALQAQYRIETPEQAVQLARMAYDNVTKSLRGMIKRPEVRQNTAGQRTANSQNAKPEPRNFEEACLIAAGFTPP
jgi:hypothetical protein